MTTSNPTPTDPGTTSPARDLVPGPPVRVAVDRLNPRADKAMQALDAAARRTDLEPALQELVRARASQINGCTYCVDVHLADARAAGLSERTLHQLAVWRESPMFTARERAALELTEAITRLSDGPVPDALFDRVADELGEQEVADLVWLASVINTWNRLAVTSHAWPVR